MTEKEKRLSRLNGVLEKEYERAVVRRIRQKYSLAEELSLHRQKDRKPKEYAAMCAYIDACVAEAKSEVYGSEA